METIHDNGSRTAAAAGSRLGGDLYPTLGQVPGFDGIYRMLTGRQAPQREGQPAKAAAAPAAPGLEPWTYKPLWEPDQPAP